MFNICQIFVYNWQINVAGIAKRFNIESIDRHLGVIDTLAIGMISIDPS